MVDLKVSALKIWPGGQILPACHVFIDEPTDKECGFLATRMNS